MKDDEIGVTQPTPLHYCQFRDCGLEVGYSGQTPSTYCDDHRYTELSVKLSDDGLYVISAD